MVTKMEVWIILMCHNISFCLFSPNQIHQNYSNLSGYTKISGWILFIGCSLLISDIDYKLDSDPYYYNIY